MRAAIPAFLVVIGLAAPMFAQDKPVEINVGGGATFPLSGFKDSFNTGGNFDIGATFWVTPSIGILAEYDYTRMNGPEKNIIVTPSPADAGGVQQFIQSNQQIHAGVFDVVGRSHHRDSVVNAYAMGGLGIYHRGIQLTSPAVGYTTICNPYWLVCYPVPVSVSQILGERTSNDFGINFGAGATFGHEAKFYIEARYTYVWGPTITPPASNLPTTPTTFSSNAQYFP